MIIGDIIITLLGATFKKETGDDLILPRDLISMGLLSEEGQITNAGLLLSDQGALKQSKIVCTRWKGKTKGEIDGDALDDQEFSESCLINLLNNAESFIRNNSRNGSLDAQDREAIKRELPGYFQAHLDKDLFAYVIRDGQNIVSCAFFLIVEKPMSPAFINGRTGIVLNVYTCPAYRRRGYARIIMEALLLEAKKMEISVIELKATEDGYLLYCSMGFMEDVSKYHLMKWKNKWRNIK